MLNKIRMTAGVLMIASIAVWLIGGQIAANSTTPGTVSDPLITKSYVDMKVDELKVELMTVINGLGYADVTPPTETEPPTEEPIVIATDMEEVQAYIDEQIDALEPMTSVDGGDSTSSLFGVVEATNGQRLICGASAEVILRAGAATVIAGAEGDGLANLTSGVDLRGGDEVPLQHHLLVSRDDGRGLLITSNDDKGKSYIMVKGDYTLE